MKLLGNHLVLICLLLGLSLAGCEKETVLPASTDTISPALRGGVGHFRPDQQCGTSRFGEMTNGTSTFGTVEILNDASEFYLLFDMNNNFFMETVFVYFGTNSGIPTNSSGEIVMEDFQYQAAIDGGAAKYTVTYPTASLPICNDLVAFAVISERNMFGNVIANHQVWLDGTAIHNGYSFKYCVQTCNITP